MEYTLIIFTTKKKLIKHFLDQQKIWADIINLFLKENVNSRIPSYLIKDLSLKVLKYICIKGETLPSNPLNKIRKNRFSTDNHHFKRGYSQSYTEERNFK